MAGTFMPHQTVCSVLCRICGILMAPNPANMCVKCLCSEIDITEGLQKHVMIIHCPECDRYLQPPRTWLKAQLESKELLTFCLKRLKSMNQVRLVHAEFIWTEPHSKRIKVKLRVQKEVINGAVLEQAYLVEYVLQDQMCESCSRVQADPDQWVASVQIRQHVSHNRTFFYLNHLILKHDAAIRAIGIKQMDRGIDFLFVNRSHAVKFVEFVQNAVPVRSRHDIQRMFPDIKIKNHNHRHTFSVEICPVCREDLVCLPPKLAVSLGNLGPLVICTKISNNVALLDPLTLRHCFLDAEQYWREPFTSFLTSKQLVEYVVLDVEQISSELNVCGSKYMMADVQVARVSDFGKNDTMFFVRTHLGHLLNVGDYALGYDLDAANNNDTELDKYKDFVIPQVILVKKRYERQRQIKLRSWKPESNKAIDPEEERDKEYEKFKRDLEQNPERVFNISLYGEKAIEELFDDLKISDAADG